MQSIKTIRSIACGFILAATYTANATDLMEVYAMAERNDAELRAASASYNAIRQQVPQSRAGLLPQLSGTVRSSTATNEIEDSAFFSNIPGRDEDSDIFGYTISLRQSIYNHSFWQRLKQANANVAKAEAEYQATRQNLILRTATAYFNVLAAIDNLEFAEAEKTSVGQQLEQSKQRFDVGLIAITDVKESQAQYDQAVASEIAARNQLSNTREALWTITNFYPERLNPLSADMPLLEPQPTDKQQWVDKALNENLSLLAAGFERTAAKREVSIQRSGHYPSLDLVANREFSDTEGGNFGSSEQTNTLVGVELSIPILQGGGVSAKVKEAVYNLEASRERQEATRRQVIQQTRDAYQNVIAGISRSKALKQALVSSQAAYEATEAGFEVGTRNSVDVLISLRNTFAAKRDHAQTRYEYLLDTLRLKQAAGNLSQGDLEAINRWLQ